MTCDNQVKIRDPNKDIGLLEVDCGQCAMCLEKRRNDWSFRLQQETKTSKSAFFVTLTYNDEQLPITHDGIETLYHEDFQKFMKRLRKKNINESYKRNNYESLKQAQKETIQIRYYMVGEYGTENMRPHYHVLLYNIQPTIEQDIETIWGMGRVDVGQVEPASIHYVSGYVNTKSDFPKGAKPPYNAMSKGIGKSYLDTTEYHTSNEYLHVQTPEGFKQRLPRYYREKMFSKEHLQKIMEKTIPEMEEEKQKKFERLRATGECPASRVYDNRQLKKAKINNNKKSKTL